MALTDFIAIDLPIIQAPMAGVQNWELAVAVARGGGLGSIPCGMLSIEQIIRETEQFTRHSDKPYNLNFFCHAMPEKNAGQLAQWRELLQPFYRDAGINESPTTGTLRMPFSESIADAIEAFKPPVISFHFGLPSPALVKRVKSWGTRVFGCATTVAEGVWLQEHGADAVIAQGLEAGGHRGIFLSDDLTAQLATLPLVSQLVDCLTIPVVATGAVASARDVKAMLQLGACGVQVGTSYLLCDEAKTSTAHRNALKDSQASTAITNLLSGRPARGIRNRLMRTLGDIHTCAPEFPYASIALAPLRQYAEAKNLGDFSPLWAGQNRSGCRAVSATQLTQALWTGE